MIPPKHNGFERSLHSWVAKKNRGEVKYNAANKVLFLAARDDIRNAIDKGISAKLIWQFMKESQRIECCYTTFSRYVKRYIKNQE